MADWSRVPDWAFGEVVRNTILQDCLALVLGWDYQVDYNPSESIVILLALTPFEPVIPGEIFRPYCGWWEPVREVR